MSPIDFKSTKLSRNEARKLVSKIMTLYSGNIYFSRHAMQELSYDDLSTVDTLNLLKSSDSRIHDEGELINGSFRYRLETSNILLVVAFQEDGKGLTVITAWDKRKRTGDKR